MKLTYHDTDIAYNDKRYDFVALKEMFPVGHPRYGERYYPTNVGDKMVTMGAGLNLTKGKSTNRYAVYSVLGFKIDMQTGHPPIVGGTAAQRVAEDGYISRLNTILRDRTLTINQKQVKLDKVMADRVADSTLDGYADNRKSYFVFESDQQVRDSFDLAVKYYEDDLKKKLDKYAPSVYADPAFANSKEHVVLLSLYWNGESLVSKDLMKALSTGNRAEAWFEIRYKANTLGYKISQDGLLAMNSNDLNNYNHDFDKGWANRRYDEANLFSLYDPAAPDKLAEAKDIYRMFTKHREQIDAYEKVYGIALDRSLGSRGNNLGNLAYAIHPMLDPAKMSIMVDLGANANQDITNAYQKWVTDQSINRATFDPTKLFIDVGNGTAVDARQYLNGAEVASNDIVIGHDTQGSMIVGGQGNDLLIGGTGDDVLYGNEGDDVMAGGDGNDTYIINANEGNDTIEDKSGTNKVVFNGNAVDILFRQADGTFKSADGKITAAMQGTDLVLTDTATGAQLTLNQNFTEGDFGITFQDAPVDPVATNTINGDLSPNDSRPDVAGIQAVCDANGNPIDGVAQPYADMLSGSAGNDHIIGGDLNDDIGGGKSNGAGDDWVEGGAGSDYIWTGLGNDLIEGSSESDMLHGGDGNDQLFGDANINIDTAIANGTSGTGTGNKGDWLDGASGDDTLVGTADNDVLAGGGGKDLLIAGAGDDYILGDSDYFPTWFWADAPSYLDVTNNTNWYHSAPITLDWGVTLQGDTYVFAPVYTQAVKDPADSGNDIIYAGAGDDHVWAGSGDDVVYGEDGNDSLSGEAGNDILIGGAGDDKLFGDGSDPAMIGDDYLDGGDGNDSLSGEAGNDTLIGGKGDDKLLGGIGANYLDGEDGNDTLQSQGASGTLIGGIGDDNLAAWGGNNYLDGGDGTDDVYAEDGGNTLFGGAGDDSLTAKGGNNYLDGEAGNNRIIAEGGGNQLIAGSGDDTLSAAGGNNYLDGGEGTNRVIADGGGNTLFAGAGNDTLSAGGGNNYLDGGDGTNLLIAEGGGNTLFSGTGDDTLSAAGGNNYLEGGAGNDQLIADLGGNTLYGGTGDDRLSATGGSNYQDGGDGADTLIAEGFNNILVGGAGDDFLIARQGGGNLLDGGEGLDFYVFDAGFGENHISDSGIDPATGKAMGGNVAQFNFNFAGSGIVLGIGSLKLSFANGDVLHIDGFDPEDPLNTCAITSFQFTDRTLSLQEVLAIGAPDMTGTASDDVLTGTGLRERIFALDGNDTIDAGAGNDYIDGGQGNDLLNAGSGDDYLIGGAGEDTMLGGRGDDIYIVDSSNDLVAENINEGTDSVLASASYVLSDNIENLTLTGMANLEGTGNALDNLIQGNNGNNVLTSGEGNDTLYGLDGNDVLDGGAGADSMTGGYGNDTYGVDDANDQVIEAEAGPIYTDYWSGQQIILADTDTVNASISYTLGNNLENLNLIDPTSASAGQATLNLNGTGNALDNIINGNRGDNVLLGNEGVDVLDGGAGADWLEGGEGDDTLKGGAGANTLIGGAGSDTYFVDSAADVVVETQAGSMRSGTQYSYLPGVGWGWHPYTYFATDYEIVYSSVTFSLSQNLEDLTLVGTDDINGTGNALANVIVGNAGVNVLSGGAGNDKYYVQTVGDVVIEDAVNGEVDQVYASVDFVMGANVENLTLTEAETLADDALMGTGNASDNVILGNNADNTLSGEGGNDFLNGRAGNDLILGGEGDDSLIGGQDDSVRNLQTWGWQLLNNADTLDGGAGNDYIDGGSGDDSIMGGMGNDDLFGGNDQGGEGSDVLTNNDMIDGGDGNDRIDGGTGADRLYGGAGDDTIVGGVDGMSSSQYFDFATQSYVYGSSDDYLDGGEGNDTLDGGSGADIVLGGAGDDVVQGGSGDDVLEGGRV